jgi:anti-anti-sigma factor
MVTAAAAAFETSSEPISGVPGACVVHIRGQVTAIEVPQLREALLLELSNAQDLHVVIELGGVQKMDTAGAAVLVEAVQTALESGRKMLVCSPGDSVVRMFRLAGLEEVLTCCCSDPDETLRRLLEL